MTKTGGRSATVRHIAGECALSVGLPNTAPPDGWCWIALTDVARLESGHTPSRKHPEYWGGDIPWLSIRDAKAHHGGVITKTIETTNDFGIENSSARILPKGTVCLSRTASVGYVTILGCPMATSQDFVNWVCSERLEPRFLQYLLISERPSLARFSSGAVHQTIYFPEVKAFHVCIPDVEEQRRIVSVLDEVFAGITAATANLKAQMGLLSELSQSLLFGTFSGELATNKSISPGANDNFATPKGAAQIIAFAYWLHKKNSRDKSYKHVKAQKCLHNVESIGAVELGRQPRKFPYGPHDPTHMAQAEAWARDNGFFEFVPSTTGLGLDFRKLSNYDALWSEAKVAIRPVEAALVRAIEPLISMNMEEAELFATVHAAWNNLLHDGRPISDEAIVREAREDWDQAKTEIPRHRFFDTIKLIRMKRIEPDGSGKYVGGQARLF